MPVAFFRQVDESHIKNTEAVNQLSKNGNPGLNLKLILSATNIHPWRLLPAISTLDLTIATASIFPKFNYTLKKKLWKSS